MHKKALTVAIAGALAAPLAAQAVDFTISGHINRALFITDNDAGTESSVKDNGSSGTRVRVTGSSEMETGGSAGVNLEYAANSGLMSSAGKPTTGLTLRYGEVWYGGEFGKVSVGQGDQGGEGSVYPGQNAAVWIAHGQDKGASTLGDYFGSLDGGAGRNERIRYDAPSVGPISAAVSVGNGDQVSAGITLSQDFAGTAFSAKVGTVQWPGDKGTLSASAGVKLPAGIIVSGAWGKGKHHVGMPEVAAIPAMFKYIDTDKQASMQMYNADGTLMDAAKATFDEMADNYQMTIMTGQGKKATDQQKSAGEEAQKKLMALFDTYACTNLARPDPTGGTSIGDPSRLTGSGSDCAARLYSHAKDAVPETQVDPSFYQAAVGYVFGTTKVGVSWYQSQDFKMEGSKGTAIGIGVDHVLPKVNANVYASVQNYKVTPMKGGESTDDTVVMIGTRIKF